MSGLSAFLLDANLSQYEAQLAALGASSPSDLADVEGENPTSVNHASPNAALAPVPTHVPLLRRAPGSRAGGGLLDPPREAVYTYTRALCMTLAAPLHGPFSLVENFSV